VQNFTATRSRFYGPIITSGLVLNLDAGQPASYPGSGTIWTDLSGSGNNGTLEAGAGYTNVNGSSIVFDGVNDRVVSPNSTSLQITVGTISAWVRATSANTGVHGIIAKQQAWGLFVWGNTLRAYDWGTGAVRDTGITIGNNTWNHVAMTFTQTIGTPVNNAIIYLNGTAVLTTTVRHASQAATFQVGDANAGQYLSGNVAQALVYNRVLSAGEIQQNFNALRDRFGV
jgi:hypothetical protein